VRTCKAATASRKDRPRCRKAATQPRPHRPDGKLARCHVHGLIKPDWDQDIDADWTRRDPPSVIDSDSEDESDVASEDEDGDVADSGHGSTGLIQRYSRSTSRTGSMSSRHRSITPSRATRAGSGDEPVGSSSSSSSSSGLSARSSSVPRGRGGTSHRESTSSRRSTTPHRSTQSGSFRTPPAVSHGRSGSEAERLFLQSRRESYVDMCHILGEGNAKALFDSVEDAILLHEQTSELLNSSDSVLLRGVDNLMASSNVHANSIANLTMGLSYMSTYLDELNDEVSRMSVGRKH
jgi:hypothetical protein